MNKGDLHKEKKLYWSVNTGFHSENSDDEMTNFNRVQRLAKHGKDIYLRSRPILPWEKMMLRFGGSEIIKKIGGK